MLTSNNNLQTRIPIQMTRQFEREKTLRKFQLHLKFTIYYESQNPKCNVLKIQLLQDKLSADWYLQNNHLIT